MVISKVLRLDEASRCTRRPTASGSARQNPGSLSRTRPVGLLFRPWQDGSFLRSKRGHWDSATRCRPHRAWRYLSGRPAKQLKKELRAGDAAGHRADRSADQEAAHARVIAVTPITFDVGAKKSARKKPADGPSDRAGNEAFLRPWSS